MSVAPRKSAADKWHPCGTLESRVGAIVLRVRECLLEKEVDTGVSHTELDGCLAFPHHMHYSKCWEPSGSFA